jgi:uncharacterized membrane protein YtjA (UPF0391 family)
LGTKHRVIGFFCHVHSDGEPEEIEPMPGNLIYYAIVLIVVALLAALFGFGGVASTAMGGAHLLIWLAVIIVIVGVVFALMRRA